MRGGCEKRPFFPWQEVGAWVGSSRASEWDVRRPLGKSVAPPVHKALWRVQGTRNEPRHVTSGSAVLEVSALG